MSHVTVVCATRNAREAVRLTFESFERTVSTPCQVLVADNGSTDGALEELQRFAWIEVVPLERRRELLAESHAAAASLAGRLADLADTLDQRERMLLGALVAEGPAVAIAPDDPAVTEHGATLDWLTAQVETPFVLTLDSDVEFRRHGWLDEMLAAARREQLDALGPHDPGHDRYRPRLAPHVLLLRTSALRALRTSFRSHVDGEPADVERWLAARNGYAFSFDELERHPGVRVYSTAALLFERLQQACLRWRAMPEDLLAAFHHLEHASWERRYA